MTVRIPTELRRQHGSFLSAGEPLVFHCHHYNVALQKTIEECLPDDYAPLLTDAATEVVAAQLASVLAHNPHLQSFAARLQVAAELSRVQGFGLVQLEGDASGGRAVALRSHYSHGWLIKHGPRNLPTCWFHAGYLAAAYSAAAGTPPGSFEAVEVECAAAHGKRCVFEIRPSSRPIRHSVGEGQLPRLLAPPVGPTGNIQSQAVTDAVLTLPLEGNEEGLIPAFGVYLTRHYANYYNRISYQFEQQLAQLDTSLLEPARLALIEAGHRCAFHTFGGITQSAEWDGLILPMCRDRSDWFHGIVACINAFGWGCWRTVELVPGERVVVDVFGSYESNGRLAMYGQADQGSCHLHNGGIAGLMNLLWVGDLTSRPVLDTAYYNSLYSASESFVGEEIRCRSRGDDRCTVVATRKRFA